MSLPASNPTAAIRHRNIQRLIDECGKAAVLARKSGKDPRQISAWATGAKKISDETARELEVACRKPLGWMDNERPAASPELHSDSRTQSHPSRLDPDKMRDAMTLLRHLAELRDVPELVSDPVALAIAYEVVMEFDTPLTDSNVLDLTKRLAAAIKGEPSGTQERSKTA